ncbi:hypothetical protein J1614_000198 [Plenodomus biglobosus]|nr:hypothetical protein J1614_000198 [Plenodomus biglobosus]
MADSDTQGADYEAEHVHSVYEEIAQHFSSTRYKPWPIVERFLKQQKDGAIGLDIGCGNGKYLAVNKNVFIVGSDRSTNLVKIAKQHTPHSTVVADTLALPHPARTFDFAISIAVIHHLSTPARRIEAVKCVLDVLRRRGSDAADQQQQQGGTALIYVWALEQRDSRRGWDEGHAQDVMVPWVLKEKREKKGGKRGRKKEEEEKEEKEGLERLEGGGEEAQGQSGDRTFLRYYHLYRKGELERDVELAGGVVVDAGYEKDNWWVIAAASSM